jgi:hypothetical protein
MFVTVLAIRENLEIRELPEVAEAPISVLQRCLLCLTDGSPLVMDN